jgi:hypothetical protein
MPRIVGVLIACVLFGGQAGSRAQAPADAARLKQQLVGAYKLVSFDNIDQSGRATRSPYTIGQIMYDSAGRMSAQLSRPARPKYTAAQPTDSERAAAYASYISYFGRYELDAQKKTVTHHVEGAVNPNSAGTPLTRHFAFSPDSASLFLEVRDGERVTARLQWDRYR